MIHIEAETHDSSELARLCQYLRAHNFKLAHLPASPLQQRAVEELLVIAGQDQSGQNIMLKIYFAEDLSQVQALQKGQNHEPDWGSLLVFKAPLPGKVYTEQVLDLSHLVGVINRSMPLGAFVASREKGLCFQYQLIGPNQHFEAALLEYVLQQIFDILEQFEPFFQAYLNKIQPLSELLNELGVVP